MTALPQIQRCAAAQWRGLTDEERDTLTRAWTCADLRAVVMLSVAGSPQREYPLWQVTKWGLGHLTLVSVKVDVVDLRLEDEAKRPRGV